MSIELTAAEIAEVARKIELPKEYVIKSIRLNPMGCECIIHDTRDNFRACMYGSVRTGRIAEYALDDTAAEYAWDVLAEFTR